MPGTGQTLSVVEFGHDLCVFFAGDHPQVRYDGFDLLPSETLNRVVEALKILLYGAPTCLFFMGIIDFIPLSFLLLPRTRVSSFNIRKQRIKLLLSFLSLLNLDLFPG